MMVLWEENATLRSLDLILQSGFGGRRDSPRTRL